MADETYPTFVSSLSDIGTLNATDEIVVVRSGVSYSTTPAEIATYVGGTISGGYTQGVGAAGGTQSIADNTLTNVAFDASDLYDTDIMHDPVTNNDRIVCNTAGKYLFTPLAVFASNATGLRLCALYLNGSVLWIYDRQTAISGASTVLGRSMIIPMVVSDYVVMKVLQTSGGALNLSSAYCGVQRVG